jgi:predicted aldo/keto reductase-like oxidoreductase
LIEKDNSKITRREFIKTTGGVVVATSVGASALTQVADAAENKKKKKEKKMEKRQYGDKKDKLSIIGFGGIIVMNETAENASADVSEAINNGINYFDVAPSYGNAEDMLGPALEPYRKDVFLACKTGERTKDKAQMELESSLKKLKTDHFDLYQLHGMTSKEDFETAMGPNGAIKVLEDAKKKGIVRYLGFSAHSAEIAIKLMDSFDFDSVLFPINWVCYFNSGFGPQVVEKAKSKKMGIFALKAMARSPWGKDEEKIYPKCWYRPVTDPEETDLAVRFTLSQPITAALTPGEIRLFRKGVEVGSKFKHLKEEELVALKKRAEGLEPIFKLASA